MAPTTIVLTVLLFVSLMFTGHVRSEQQHLGGGSEEGPEQQEPLPLPLPPAPVAGGAFLPDSQCGETRLYTGPCVELLCAVACLVEMRQGGHCTGNFIIGHCYCFSCS